jgi:hypothetical protein
LSASRSCPAAVVPANALIERDARSLQPAGLPALGEGRTGPATARAVFSLLEDTTLTYSTAGVTVEPPAAGKELFERLTAEPALAA